MEREVILCGGNEIIHLAFIFLRRYDLDVRSTFFLTTDDNMGKVMDRTTAKATLRDIARFKTIGISKHCRNRMMERNVSMEDIVHVLMWGTITDIETVDPDRWRCTVTGEDLDGDALVLVAALDAANEAACVTVY